MKLHYEEYLKLHSLEVLIPKETGEEFEGKILGCRNDEKGDMKSLLIQSGKGEVKPLLIEKIKYILPKQ